MSPRAPTSAEIQNQMGQFRSRLLAAGMQEPIGWNTEDARQWRFYKPVTELTAFVCNLRPQTTGILVTYGYASTAFTRMAGSGNALARLGIFDEDIVLREQVLLPDETAASQIQAMYHRYQHTEKDALLAMAKEKRKAFLQQFHLRLKPLGFRKKANTWKRALEGEYYLMFNAQKSAFSDTYYFNLYIGKEGTNHYGDCYYTRLAPEGPSPTDWQTLTQADLDLFLDRALVPALEEILRTPLEILGKNPAWWRHCHCPRDKCPNCWMEKNLWEDQEST